MAKRYLCIIIIEKVLMTVTVLEDLLVIEQFFSQLEIIKIKNRIVGKVMPLDGIEICYINLCSKPKYFHPVSVLIAFIRAFYMRLYGYVENF